MRIFGILLAGGTGSRMNLDKPKQFLAFRNKTIMEYTIEKFVKCSSIDEIVLVMNSEYIGEAKGIIERNNYGKIIDIIPGGNTRQESTYNALKFIEDRKVDIVVIHDSVRPFVTNLIIENAIVAAIEYDGSDVCVKTTDTIVCEKDGFILQIPDRNILYNGQTPQTFKYNVIKSSHERALQEKFIETTDDVKIALRYGYKIKIVEGSYSNIKLTTQEDIEILKRLFEIEY